ncbi:glycosyltransferase [Haliea sp. E17]|uniref:glycosyltransferase n=1 Tax=Haliea sp. E17 TaxID=3401576 RepID=UPI003AAF6B11
MLIAFVVFEPGELAAVGIDLRQLLRQARARGHACCVYSTAAADNPVDGVSWRQLPVRERGRHRRHAAFLEALQEALARDPARAVLGFEPLPGLDAVLCATLPRAQSSPGRSLSPRRWLSRRGGAEQYFRALESRFFRAGGAGLMMYLSTAQQAAYQQQYALPSAAGLVLPPGVATWNTGPEEARKIRRDLRQRLQVAEGELLLLFAGSDFQRAGLARAIHALAHARGEQVHQKLRLLVAADGRYRSYHHLARKLGVRDAVEFLRNREPLDAVLLAADTLVHPAQAEAAAPLLLRALLAGLPVITTEDSGYADHIAAARAGLVMRHPFRQADLDHAVLRCIDGIYRAQCRESGTRYIAMTDLHTQLETCLALLERHATDAAGVGAPGSR